MTIALFVDFPCFGFTYDIQCMTLLTFWIIVVSGFTFDSVLSETYVTVGCWWMLCLDYNWDFPASQFINFVNLYSVPVSDLGVHSNSPICFALSIAFLLQNHISDVIKIFRSSFLIMKQGILQRALGFVLIYWDFFGQG